MAVNAQNSGIKGPNNPTGAILPYDPTNLSQNPQNTPPAQGTPQYQSYLNSINAPNMSGGKFINDSGSGSGSVVGSYDPAGDTSKQTPTQINQNNPGINPLGTPTTVASPGTGGSSTVAGGSPNVSPQNGGNFSSPGGILGFPSLNKNQQDALNYASGSGFNNPQSEGDIYTNLSGQLDGMIQQIKDAYSGIIRGDQNAAQNANIDQRVQSAMTGQGGSGNASASAFQTAQNSNTQIAKDQEAKAAALTSIYQQIQSNAISYAQYQQTQANTDATTAASTLASISKAAMGYVASIAATGVDPATLQQNDPATWQQLMDQTGMSSYALTQYMASQLPSSYQPQVNTTYSVAPDGTTIANVTISKFDPTTGKISATTSTSPIPVPFAQFNSKSLISLPNGSSGYINNQGQVIDLSTGKQYIPVTTVASGGALLNTATGAAVGTGEPNQTVVPITSSVVSSGPAVGNGQSNASGGSGATGSGGSGSGATGSGGGNGSATDGAPTAPGSATGLGSNAPTGNFANGLDSNGQASWQSLASLQGVSGQQLSFLKETFGTPQAAYNQGIQWILNGGSSSSSGSSMGSGGIKIVNGNVASAIGTGILQSYGLTQQDANVIAETDTGLSSSLTGMLQRQATVQQYIQKSQTQAQILNSAMKNYGQNGASPLVNSVVQAFQKNIYSDPSFNSFQVALGTFLKDYARISDNATGSGAATTDASNASAAEKLSTLMSQGSLQSALATMWDEMNAQVSSLGTSVTGLQQSLGNLIQNYAASKNQASGASSLGQSGSTTAMANTSAPSGTTQMIGTDGSAYYVPNANVAAATKAGWKTQ